MADLATLGIAVDSGPLQRLATDLNAVVPAAEKTEKAVDKAGKGVDGAMSRMGGASKYTERMLAAMERIEKAVRDVERAMEPMAASVNRTNQAMEKAVQANDNAAKAAEKAGVSYGTMGGSVDRAQRKITETAKATEQAAAVNKKLDETVSSSVRNMGLYVDAQGKLRSATGGWASNIEKAEAVTLAMAGALDEQSVAALRAVGALNEHAVAAGKAAQRFAAIVGPIDAMSQPFEQATAAYERLTGALANNVIGDGRFRQDVERVRQAFIENGGTVDQWGKIVERNAQQASQSMGGVEQAVSMAKRALGALGLALGVREIINYADAWSDMQSRVGAAIRNMDAAPQMMQRLVQIANESYSSLGQTVETYSRNVMVLRDLGRGADEAATFTSALNNALVLTATRGEQAASVQGALSKAMAVGKLQADGLETVLANGGAVAEALAEELGTTVNGLRDFAAAGQITSNVIANSLIKRADEFSERVQEMPSTVQDAILRLQNNFTAFVGTMDSGTGASAALSDAIMFVANNLEDIARVAGIAATAIGTYYAQALVQATAAKIGFGAAAGGATGFLGVFTTAAAAARRGVDALTAALARNPLGLFVVGASTAIAALTLFRDEIVPVEGEVASLGDYLRALGETSASVWSAMTDHVNDWSSAAIGAIATYVGVQNREANLLPESWGQAWEEIQSVFARATSNVVDTLLIIPSAGAAARIALVDAWGALPNGLGEATIEAARIVLLTIEEMVDGAISLVNQAIQGANDMFGLGLSKIPGIVGTISNYLSPVPEDAKAAGEEAGRGLASRFSEAFTEEHGRRRGTVDGIMSSITNGFQSIRDRANEIGAARTQVDVLNDALAGTSGAAGGAAAGMGDTSKAAQEAADAAKKLADEADRLWAQQNPFEAAVAEAQRLLAAVDDLANGLTDAQRAALRIEADDVLRRLTPKAEEASKGVRLLRDEFLDLGKAGSDAVDTIFGALTQGGNVLDNLMNGLARLNTGFMQAGADRIKDMMGLPTSRQQTGISGGYDARIDARAFGTLNDNLRQSSRSALDVARQFDGLNERADSRVLDSFMQASGTWRNLSARDTAWCAAFANAALVESGQRGTGSNLASSFMGWGTGTNAPKPGDIVVLRPQARGASGHVGFFDGFDDRGNVRVFGGNQSNAANTRTFGAGEVRSFRTAVAGGVIDAQRAMATGQAGVVASGPSMSGAASSAVAGGWGGFGPVAGQGNAQLGMMGRVGQFMQSPLGMGGMNAFSAFGAGMSSGSPISGGLSGGLGAIGMGLGPVGIAAGVVGGLLGGIFGRSRRKKEERRQREEQERQQRLQAQQQLDQQLPAILELQDTLLDRASGTLMKEKARIESQIKQYQTLAKTAKNQTEIDRLNSMADSLNDYMERQYDQLRLTASSVIQSMLTGRGLEPEFAKAVSAVREQSLAVRNYIADLTAATGAGSAEVQAATAAGREQLLRMLSGAEEVTEIWTKLDSLTGTASQLSTELQKLGANAEEAAVAIADHLGRGIQRLRDEFVRGIADETAEGMGLGYLPQLRSLMERRETMRADATSLGADPALIDRWFGVQARNILDQAGLLDKEIAPLVAAFPELANVLGDASAKIERSLADAENDLRTAYSRVRQFADHLAAFRDDIKLDRNLSTLGPEERLLEAQKQFRAVAEKAAAGDAEAQGELINLSRSYLDEAKSFYASSEAYYAIFREVDGTLKSTEAKAVAELDLAKSQYGALLDLNESVKTIPQALDALNTAMAARDLAQGQALQAYVQALNPQAAIPSYQAPGPVTGNPAPTPTPAPAPPPPAPVENVSLWNGAGFSNYVGNYKTFMGRTIFVPSGWSDDQAFQLFVRQQDAPRSAGGGFFFNEKRFGGAIGHGFAGLTGFQTGGMIGNGIYDVDSVIARHASGGAVALAGGEFVTTARGVNAQTRPMLDFINREHRLPAVAMPAAPRSVNDSSAVVAELRGLRQDNAALRSELAAVRQAVGLGAVETVGAVERGTRVAQERAMEAKRQRAAA